MKVLIYADLNFPSFAGGIQTYMVALIKALGDLNEDDEFIVLGPDLAEADWLRPALTAKHKLVKHDPGWQPFLHRGAGVAARQCRRLLRSILHSPSHRRPVLNWLRRLASTAGIQVSNGYYESFGAAVIHFPFQRFVCTRLPSVYNPHDLQHLHLPQFWTPSVFAERELQYYYACRHATRIAVASSWIASDLQTQYGLPRQKISTIPWGAPTAVTIAPDPEEIASVRHRYSRGEPFVFYPAVGWPHKNHDRLFAALGLLKKRGHPLRLVISGGPSYMTDPLRESCRRHGVTEEVTVAGIIPDVDMRPLYRAARAIVVPTLFEAASGPVAEAWLEGTPATCSDLPQLREQAQTAALFFDPLSPSAIADAIMRITSDEMMRENLIAAGTKRIGSHSWDETAVRYRQLYAEAAAAGGRS